MKLSKPAIFFALAILFLGGIGARVATTSRLDSPYLKGDSAMHHRLAMEVAGGASLRATHKKANHPQGFVPARVAPQGSELVLAGVMRMAAYLGSTNPSSVTRRFVVILSALCVFTAYGVARRLWDCQASGLIAGALVAFLPPLVQASNGREYSHGMVAALVGSLHALLVLRAMGAPTRRKLVTASIAVAVTAYALLAVWEGAGIVIALWMLGVAVWRPLGMRTRITVLAAHAVAVIAGLATLPHLTSGESFPVLGYLATRLHYLATKPASASLLSDQMRHVWSLEHAPLTSQATIQVFLPLLLLAVALVMCAELRARRRVFIASGVVALLAAAVAVLDRGALPVAAMALIPVVAGGAYGPTPKWRWRIPLVVLAVYCAFAGVVFRQKGLDVAFQVTNALGVAHQDPDAFLWVSLENTDRELVRFLMTRTQEQDVILAPNDLSALLLAYTRRTQVLLPAASSPAAARKHVTLTRSLYGDETDMHQICRKLGIDYVVYSIDFLLDPGRYSPRYLAGLEGLTASSLAFQMHFSPESLRYFTLRYENEHYRLFEVTDGPETIFLTDHPPVYQRDLLRAVNGDLAVFQQNLLRLVYSYITGMKARTTGDLAGAVQALKTCTGAAPRFTQAQLALAGVYMDLQRYQEARDVVMQVIAYAPDNTRALYQAAYLSARLQRFDEARSYLKLLRSIEHDPDLLQRASMLETYMDQNLPLEPVAPAR